MKQYIIVNPVMTQAAAGRLERAAKLIVFNKPMKTADGVWHGFLSARTSAFFKQEIDKAPADAAILIDLHGTERPEFESGLSRSKRARAGLVESQHADNLRLDAGFVRLALLPVGAPPPKTKEESATICYSISEIVKVFCNTCFDFGVLWPDAEKHRERKALLPKIARLGGQRRAHYSYEEIILAFSAYRRERPKGTLWDACRWLTRPGHPLDDYKKDSQRSLHRHVKKMIADGNFGFYSDAEAWFSALVHDAEKI